MTTLRISHSRTGMRWRGWFPTFGCLRKKLTCLGAGISISTTIGRGISAVISTRDSAPETTRRSSAEKYLAITTWRRCHTRPETP